MAFDIHTGDIIKAEFWCESRTQYSLNVRYYHCTNSILSPVIPSVSFVSILHQRARTVYRPALATNARYYGTRISLIQQNPPDSEFVTGLLNGAFPGLAMPLQVAGLIRTTTGFFGRKNKGRSYIPFPSHDAHSQFDGPTAAYNTAAAGLVQMLGLGTSIGTGALGSTLTAVTRRQFDGVHRSYVQAHLVQRWATMRTRSTLVFSDVKPF